MLTPMPLLFAPLPTRKPGFQPGDMVRHKRTGTIGTIVSVFFVGCSVRVDTGRLQWMAIADLVPFIPVAGALETDATTNPA